MPNEYAYYLGPKTADIPEEFLKKMEEFIKIEKDFFHQCEKLKKDYTRYNSGIIGDFLEERRVKKYNQQIMEKRDELYQSFLKKQKALIDEKKKYNIQEKLFFEYPVYPGPIDEFARGFIPQNGLGDDIYAYKKYDDAGITTILDSGLFQLHRVFSSLILGELNFYLVNVVGKKYSQLNALNPIGNNEYLLYSDYYTAKSLRGDYLYKRFMNNNELIVLYWDNEYINAHLEDKFKMYYLWDKLEEVSTLNSSYIIRKVDEILDQFEKQSKPLTDVYQRIGPDRKYKSFREVIIDNPAKISYKKEAYRKYVDTYVKKAIIIKHENRVVGIVTMKKCPLLLSLGSETVENRDEKFAVDGFMKSIYGADWHVGYSWEFYMYTTMHAMTQVHDGLSKFDASVVKPDTITDEVWSMWIRLRNMNLNIK